jgi:hypothetical protein
MNNVKREIVVNAGVMELVSAARNRLITAFPQQANRLYRNNKVEPNRVKTGR